MLELCGVADATLILGSTAFLFHICIGMMPCFHVDSTEYQVLSKTVALQFVAHAPTCSLLV